VSHFGEHGFAAERAVAAAEELAAWFRNAIHMIEGWEYADRFASPRRHMEWERQGCEYPASSADHHSLSILRRHLHLEELAKGRLIAEAAGEEPMKPSGVSQPTQMLANHPFFSRGRARRAASDATRQLKDANKRHRIAFYASEFIKFKDGDSLNVDETWERLGSRKSPIDIELEADFATEMKLQGYKDIDILDQFVLDLEKSTFASYVSKAKRFFGIGRSNRTLVDETRSVHKPESH
jgi:hypothetical protein